MPLKLTAENYHSLEANRDYMSVSQYKDFLNCEEAAFEKLKGNNSESESDALLIGSYVHAHFEGLLDEFRSNHPKLFVTKGERKGELLEKYRVAERMITAIEGDPFCMFTLQGEKETIITAELGGVLWKAKIDVLNHEQERFADIKTVRDIYGRHWSTEHGAWVSFVERYGYVLQMCVYAELERVHSKRTTRFEPAIVAVSKEDVPAIEVIGGFESRMDLEIGLVLEKLPRIVAIKEGREKPRRCERCAHCKTTRRLSGLIHYMDLI